MGRGIIIKYTVKNRARAFGLDLFGLEQELVVTFLRTCRRISSCIKSGKFLDELMEC